MQQLLDCLLPASQALLAAELARPAPRTFDLQLQGQRPDGDSFWVRMIGESATAEPGSRRLVGTLQDAFEHNDVPCRVMSAIQMNEICEPYIRRRAINHLSKGNVVIFAAGSGNPYFTTDTAAALRACEIGAEILIKATKVDGIYDKDPVKCADAVRFDKITYHEVLVRGLQVMDSTATALCQDNRMPILVLNIDGEDNVKRALSGEPVGTLVYQED